MKRRHPHPRRVQPLSPHALMIGLMKTEPHNKRRVRRRFRERAHAIPGMVDKIISDFMDTYTGSWR